MYILHLHNVHYEQHKFISAVKVSTTAIKSNYQSIMSYEKKKTTPQHTSNSLNSTTLNDLKKMDIKQNHTEYNIIDALTIQLNPF